MKNKTPEELILNQVGLKMILEKHSVYNEVIDIIEEYADKYKSLYEKEKQRRELAENVYSTLLDFYRFKDKSHRDNFIRALDKWIKFLKNGDHSLNKHN